MTDINKNIRTVFLEKTAADAAAITALTAAGADVVIVDADTLANEIKNTDTHFFNCCIVGNRAFVDAAKDTGIRTLVADRDDVARIDAQYFIECGRLERYELCEDAFIENTPDIDDVGHMESVFSLGNGYLGLRGSYDERNDDLNETEGMYINGVFETEPFKHLCYFKGFSKNDQYTVNLCDWRIIELYINGEKATVTNGMSNHKRRLDFKKGEISRSFEFTAKDGKKVLVNSVRIVNNSRPHGAVIQYSVQALNFDGEVEVRSCVVKNTAIAGKFTTSTVSESVHDGIIALETRTNRSGQTVVAMVAHKIDAQDYTLQQQNDDKEYRYIIKAKLNKGTSATIEKHAVFYSSADGEKNLHSLAASELDYNMNMGFSALREEQCGFWEKHWRGGDVIIKGNSRDQQAMRFSLFHLINQLPVINRASIGATGLTGPNYSGKVFWDTEMYLMPYYLFTNPQSCKELFLYRVKILDKARERAQQMSAVGALYSWCSIDGEETSLVFEASTAEQHINADIAYAVWQYEQATGDSEFIYENCAEMLFETAKYYAHRGTFSDAYDGRFCINSVCGPDEYACGVNNNCYTNFMVRHHLRYALDVYDRMKNHTPEKLDKITARTGLDGDELALWKKAADNMYYHVNEKYGVYEQDSHFVYNDAVDMATIPNNFDLRSCMHPLDLWRVQVLKQADVVLLQFVLGDLFTAEEKKKNYDYYEPKTNHGSSLSAAIHSIMANEVGYYDDAYEYFRSAAYMDIDDFKRNTTGGLHMACLGGVWMSVVNGFMGMRLYDDGLHFAPKLPAAWTGCELDICCEDARIHICAEREYTEFTLIDGASAEFTVYGRRVCLSEKNKTIRTENVYEN